ncbi:PCDHGB [Mytilus edulis]|uniref:PCDHGB n=1 Tax=Mytilus edulis TaxID=6550 RepID=A0A8S3RIT8_MYTED|nr:PCDHGB [Mytilus edulis]
MILIQVLFTYELRVEEDGVIGSSITITDENDNSPEIHINISPGGSEILEPAEVDRYIAYVDAQDPDSGENGTVTCTINSDYFRLESINTGMYKVKLNKLLDRETVEVHNINIICSDNGKPKRSNTTMLSIRVLDINDKFPVFNQSNYDMNVHENNKIGVLLAWILQLMMILDDKPTKHDHCHCRGNCYLRYRVAMILTIFVIRRRCDEKEQKELEVKSDKQNFVAGWLNCLSTSSKDIQKMNMGERSRTQINRWI